MQMPSIEGGILHQLKRLQDQIAESAVVLKQSREIFVEQVFVIALKTSELEKARQLVRPEVSNLVDCKDGVSSDSICPQLYTPVMKLLG